MGLKNKEVTVSDEFANDPNWRAYQEALKKGQFKDLQAGTFVAFREGQLVGTNLDRDQLFQQLERQGIRGFFFYQVGVSERVVHMRGPRIVRRS